MFVSFTTDATGGYPSAVAVQIRVTIGQGPEPQLTPIRRELFGQWVCTHCPMEPLYRSNRYINIIGQRNGVCPPTW